MMWIARDKDGTLALFIEYKPIRKDGYWTHDKNCFSRGRWMYLYNNTFPEITWEDEPQEVDLVKVIDKSNPTLFESYGAHLRNIVSPYQFLVDIVNIFLNGGITEDKFRLLLKDRNIQEGVDRIVDFSKKQRMEEINWRE